MGRTSSAYCFYPHPANRFISGTRYCKRAQTPLAAIEQSDLSHACAPRPRHLEPKIGFALRARPSLAIRPAQRLFLHCLAEIVSQIERRVTDVSRLSRAQQVSVWESDWRALGLDPVHGGDRARITFDADNQPVSVLFADYEATLVQLREVIESSTAGETRKAWLQTKARIDRKVFGDFLDDQEVQ